MLRLSRRIYQIARRTWRPQADVIAAVRSTGVDARSPNDLVPDRLVEAIERQLGFDRYAIPKRVEERKAIEIAVHGEDRAETPGEEHETVVAMAKPRLPRWPTVGQPTDSVLFVTADQVEQIHWILVEDFARSKDPVDPAGVRSRDLLESAIHRTKTSLGNEAKYPTVPMVAAALLHAIVSNHAFHNGNKRTALVSMLAFLDINGFVLEADENELFDYMLRIAAHQVITDTADADDEMLEIARWIHRHSRAISTEEKVIKFHDLRTILLRYGCTFEHPGGKGNRINITRGGKTTQVYYRNDGTDVERNTIRQIRRDLGLTDAEGYDSAIFYKAEDRVPTFIHTYRRTLDRLAKV